MTYHCPSLVRDNRFSVNLNDTEEALIQAIAQYQGKAPATIIRELALAKAFQDLTLEPISQIDINEATKKLL